MRPLTVETFPPMQPVTAEAAITSGSLQPFLDAFNHCKSGSIWKSSMQLFSRDRLLECLHLANELAYGTYKVSKYKEFNISERGKLRHIKAPAIRDRVLCHALCHKVLLPRILPHLIYDNSASVKGKGVSFARKRLLAHLRKYYARQHTNVGYILQTDFSSFFDSIPHDLLFETLKQYVPEPEIQAVIRTIIDSYNDTGVGLGIGSELSQVAGIVYPHPIDTYCKTVRQCKYYTRYMDDIYIIHHDKAFLQDVYRNMERIAHSLRLTFNPRKCHISRLDKGFSHLKGNYRLTATGKVIYSPCRKTITRERRRLKRMPEEARHDAYKIWRGNTRTQFPQYVVRSFDILYGGIQ